MNRVTKPDSQISWNRLYSEVLAQDDFDRLNVNPQSSDKKINAQFRKLAIQYHPDKNKSFKETATKIFQLILNSKDRLLARLVSNHLPNNFSSMPTGLKKAKRAEYERLWKIRVELEIIDNLSLSQAKWELENNSQARIPGFDKAEVLRRRISYLEHVKQRQKENTIFVIFSAPFICFSLYYISKDNPDALINRLIKYFKATKPSVEN